MATERYKVQGYLESEIAERFTAWKKERGIEKDSAALNELLKDYFFKPAPGAAIDPALVEEIEAKIQEKMAGLEQKIQHLENERLQKLVEGALVAYSMPLLCRLEAVEQTIKPIEGLAEISQPLPESARESKGDIEEIELPDNLTQTELAHRLNCHKSQISRHGKQSDFAEWSKERDPDAIAWNYDPKSKRYLSVK